MLHVARSACIQSHRAVRTNTRVRRRLVGCSLMDAGSPACQLVRLSLNYAIGIVTGETHLPVRTIAHQKILCDFIRALYVRVVATGALDIPVDEFHGPGWIRRLALGN